jgi:hypothetical protein
VKGGDRVRIPAGTSVWRYSNYAGGSLSSEIEAEADEERTIVAVVTVANFLSLAGADALRAVVREQIEADRLAFPDRTNTRVLRNGQPLPTLAQMDRDNLVSETQFTLSWLHEKEPRPGTRTVAYQEYKPLHEAVEAARLDAIAREGETPEFVMWGTTHDRRVARIGNVVKIADKSQVVIPSAPKKKEKAITKRQLMVEGSQWRFTKDVSLDMWVRNPLIDELCRKRNALSRSGNSQHRQGNQIVIVLGGGQKNTPAEEAEIARIQAEINAAPNMVKINVGTIPAGTEFKVVGKIVAGYKSYQQKETNGLLVPVTFKQVVGLKIKTSGYDGGLPYKLIEDAVEPTAIPETIQWVMRDRVTGDYFGGWQSEHNGNYNQQTNEPKMSSTFSGAKKYATSSAVKASIRDFTGYNDGLDDEGGAAEWVGIGSGYNTKKMDLPGTWDLVSIDKTTLAEKSVEELQTWYNGLMRLRVLTKGHGSAVRGVYKKAEGKGYEAILVFSVDEPFEDRYDDEGKALVKKIDAVTKNFSKKPLRMKSPATIAFACMLDDAYLGKLSFGSPEVTSKILDINSLEEIVENQVSASG